MKTDCIRILVFSFLLVCFCSSCSDDDSFSDNDISSTEEEVISFGGQFDKLITHDGLSRSYILYVPDSYDGDSPMPLLFNFHGYTSNAQEQMVYGDFRAIAEEEGFIIAHPLGARFNGSTHWNVGGWTIGSTIDDVGFTLAMIEEISNEYQIDQNRIYSTGMSNGGYMSFLLACQLSDKIAAIASVTGSMTPEIYDQCNPTHPTPILQIHGTDDYVVPYDGGSWSKAINEVMDYWTTYNTCSGDATIVDLPNSNSSDNSSVEEVTYSSCNKNILTQHLKVNGGGHTWPGSVVVAGSTNLDIDASAYIWEFLSQYNLQELSAE